MRAFAAWPADILRPGMALQARLATWLGAEAGTEAVPPPAEQEPGWDAVAPGIECKLLASDSQRRMLSLLVRLAPGESTGDEED